MFDKLTAEERRYEELMQNGKPALTRKVADPPKDHPAYAVADDLTNFIIEEARPLG